MSERDSYYISHTVGQRHVPGTRFERWPLHMTVVPPFSLNKGVVESDVLNIMADAGRTIGPIQLQYGQLSSGIIPLEIGNFVMFGPENTEPAVEVLDPSGKLGELHNALLKELGRTCLFTGLNPEWSGDNYHPHSTTKSGSVLDRGFICTSLTLHKKDERGKLIVDTVDLVDGIVVP